MEQKRETWATTLGAVLAVAGSAVGLGNFLRFPTQAAQNGGGAFLIPYFISFLLLGLPLIWVEWTIGRLGGGFGHGTAPGIFHTIWRKNRFIKYFGVIGIFGPTVVFLYYIYAESWLLGYTFFAASGKLFQAPDAMAMKAFLDVYRGLARDPAAPAHLWLTPDICVPAFALAYFFFLATFSLNIAVVYYGIRGGIERVCKIAMPALVLMGIALAARILTLGKPESPTGETWHVIDGLGFLWNPDFTMKEIDPTTGAITVKNRLLDAKIWLAAAGQVFFTLSVGFGVILTYASYLRRRQDVVLSGLTSATANEFVEVILGGTIVIPAAFAFFGPQKIAEIAQSGTFDLSLVTMPLIFEKLPGGQFFSVLWFALLFLAGITSSISLAQPAIAFLEDEFDLTKKEAVQIFGVITFILCQPVIFLIGQGAMDEMDFWGVNVCLVFFAGAEVVLFAWVFGINRAWDEMHDGADLSIPGVYRFIIKYVTPLCLLAIFVYWLYQEGWSKLLMKDVSETNYGCVLYTRVMLVAFFAILALLVRQRWRRREAAIAEGDQASSDKEMVP